MNTPISILKLIVNEWEHAYGGHHQMPPMEHKLYPLAVEAIADAAYTPPPDGIDLIDDDYRRCAEAISFDA